jgi:hypothetical protein
VEDIIMVSGVQPQFGAILVRSASVSDVPKGKHPLLTITLTDEDRALKPQDIRNPERPIADTFNLSLDPATPDRADINYSPQPRAQRKSAWVSKASLKPLIQAMTQRGRVNPKVMENLMENHGLKSGTYKKTPDEIEQEQAEDTAWAGQVAEEMSRYPAVTYPVGHVRKDFYPQEFSGLGLAFNLFREWVGLKPNDGVAKLRRGTPQAVELEKPNGF